VHTTRVQALRLGLGLTNGRIIVRFYCHVNVTLSAVLESRAGGRSNAVGVFSILDGG